LVPAGSHCSWDLHTYAHMLQRGLVEEGAQGYTVPASDPLHLTQELADTQPPLPRTAEGPQRDADLRGKTESPNFATLDL
jgi:hypothetical protein